MRFYFDIKDDFFAAADDEGADHPDARAAEKEAIATAASVARDVFTSGGSHVIVTLRNDEQSVLELAITLARKPLNGRS
jgi:hypothetical protein